MKRFFNVAFQVLATGGQLLNFYTPILPAKCAGWAAGILGAAQGTVSIIAHSYNTDGTPQQAPYIPPPK